VVSLAALLIFWFAGGFPWLDAMVRGLGWSEVPTGLLFVGVLVVAGTLLELPFDMVDTFVIEERYGFNRTTWPTFILDRVKGAILGAGIGGGLLALVIAFFTWAGPGAWIWCWLVAAGVMLLLQLVFPTWILPLFNRFEPLPEGSLRTAILDYAERVRFPMQNVFVLDGSKRSAKANAFFAGFGSRKRLALYDTLVEKQTEPQLVAVVAHEVGHFRRKHIPLGMLIALARLGLTLYLLSVFLSHQGLFAAFGVTEPSVYTGLVFFGLLYAPLDLVLSILEGLLSRKHEFEADRFAATTIDDPEDLTRALKTLARDNLENLTPHPFHTFLHASHPPVLTRIAAIRRVASAERGGV
jgi:STE24 endopeptidase